MNQFVDAVGPLVVICLVILAAYLVYRLVLHAAVITKSHFLELERQAISNRIMEENSRLVTVTPQAALVARAHVESGVLYGEVFDLLRADVESHRLPQPVPHHYAPHIIDRRPVAELPAPVEEAGAVVMPAQDIWQLWTAGLLPDSGFLMGHDLTTGEPVQATWRELYSALVGGASGSGKSTLIRCILAQSALQGGRFVVLDKHFGAGEESLGASLQPLRSLMLTDVASTEAQMVDALRFARNTAEDRLAGRDQDRTPLIVVTDETTGLLLRSNIAGELVDLLGLITQESRKAGVYVLAIGQQWSSQVLPTTVRNSFVSAISCRARRDVARVMSGNNEFGKIAESLTIGQAVWMKPDGDVVRLAVPNTTQRHIELVGRQLSTGVYSAEFEPPEVETGRASGQASGDPQGSGQGEAFALAPMDARASLVRQLFKGGMGRADIVREVWQMPDAKFGDSRFKRAAAELDEIIRALL
jgi:hypothetical protein